MERQLEELSVLQRRSRVRAAHVLPLAIDRVTGTVYALLGKERRVHGWSESETWSDFGGGCEATDEDPAHTAAREFWEETCALVPWGGAAPKTRVRYLDARAAIVRSACIFEECESFARALRDKEYILCAKSYDGSQVTYVKLIPFDAALPQSFDVVWRELHARFYAQVVRPESEREIVRRPEEVTNMRSVPTEEGSGVAVGITLSETQMSELLVADQESSSVTVRATFDDSPLSGSRLTQNHPARANGESVINGAFLEKKALLWVPLDVLKNACARRDGILRHDANHLDKLRSTFHSRIQEVLPLLDELPREYPLSEFDILPIV